MGVEFRLLGHVETHIDGRLVDIGHARQRCVLAALLVDADKVVTVDSLLDRVWAERLPHRARTTLSGYLSRLRQVLAGVPEVALARHPGGYRLAVDPMAVDLHRFRNLIIRARNEDAPELFAQALELWRGEPFGTLDTPWFISVRAELNAERRSAELDRNELALDRGQHAALLSELSTTAVAHPLDERLAGQLILALYRCGRQADALYHYDQLRQRLAEEVGADPGPALQHLYQRILTADPGLVVSHADDRPVPRQLPPPPRLFTGRARELADLDAILGSAGTVVISAVSGTAGVGKTALALHWVHRIAEHFGDGQLYVNLRGFDPGGSVMTPADAVRIFLDTLDVPPQRIPASLDAQAALYRSLLAGRRMLVVLDNARDVEHARPLLAGTPGCLVLVTSRDQLIGLVANEGAHPVTLDALTPSEACDLLAQRLGADRIAAEPDAVAEIITRCARLPLALAIVAARAATHPTFPLKTFAAELRADPIIDLRAVFSWSYQTLSSAAARLFRLLGLHPGPDIAASAAASLAGLPTAQIRRPLAELTHAHLLTEPHPGRYTFHDLLRTYAAEQAHSHDTEADRRQAMHRMLDHYLHTANTATHLIHPRISDPIGLAPARAGVTPEDFGADEGAMAWFTAEHRVLLAAIEHATHNGFEAHAWQLAWAMEVFLDWRGHWHDMAAACRTALRAAQRLADQRGQAIARRGLANACSLLGRYDDAHTHLQHALDLFDGDHNSRAFVHHNLAATLVRQKRGRSGEALRHARQALDLFRAAGNRVGQISTLNVLSRCHVQRGDHHQALIDSQHALTLRQEHEIGDRIGEGLTWDSLGHAHHHLGHRRQAIDCYQRALRLFRDIGTRDLEAETLTRLGDTHHATGDLDTARTSWQQALSILDELAHPDADEVRAKLTGAPHG